MSSAISHSSSKHLGYEPNVTEKSYKKSRGTPYEKPRKITVHNVKNTPRIQDVYHKKTQRDFDRYLSFFKTKGKSLQTFLTRRGEGLTVLDCGAGEGVAMDTLLSSPLGKKHVKECTGISIHQFRHVLDIIAKNEGRLEWFVGKAENVLPKLNKKFDLITDVFGAYFYSQHRLALLRLYHQTLKPGGRAYIYLGGSHPTCKVSNTIKHSKKIKENFEKHLVETFPETFSLHTNPDIRPDQFLVITKSTARMPSINFRVKNVAVSKSIHRYRNSKEALAKGAVNYLSLTLVKSKPSYSLRALPYQS